MWELNNGSYYKYEDGELTGSIIHHQEFDGRHPNQYEIQIHTSDGGLLAIGYIRDVEFNEILAKEICNMALRENKDFNWWIDNYGIWWQQNTVRA